ncbi:hypothetical protein ABGB18_12005 [Nonomuraea sp. B12E4]|uniref:hypothetical protein n=1 Tax=Nonomuraea sp. B12E4 TaxID=3153564 RepID=UPI00325D5D33
MVRAKHPRVVVDPAVPAEDRARILHLNPEDRDEAPPQPGPSIRWEPSTVEYYFRTRHAKKSAAVGVIGVAGFMVGHRSLNPFSLWLSPDLSGVLKVLGAVHDVVLVACLLAVAVPALYVLAIVATSIKFGQTSGHRFWSQYHDHYVTVGELDERGRALLGRAQQAIDDILHSEVHRDDVLDKARNESVLPQQEWEIARALRAESRLRARQTSIDIDRGVSNQRVEALEEYAAAVRAADAAYVLDRGTGESLNQSEIGDLTLHARAAESVYQDTLRSLQAGTENRSP